MGNEDQIYDHTEHKQKVTSLEHKASFTVGAVDQVEGSEQACPGQGCSSSEPNCLPTKETVDEASQKHSSTLNVRTKVLDRRRTVSEGYCPDDSQPRDDNLHLSGLVRVESSPPRIEQKERSLEECKLMLKQSVCCNWISCILSNSEQMTFLLLHLNILSLSICKSCCSLCTCISS